MKYTHRTLEEKFLRMNDFFKVLLVTGARQVGKTTMLHHLAEGTGRTYVTLDNYAARDLARRDPALFLQTYPPPVLIDEIQKAPWLTEQIKFIVDANESPGQFWLTGSQKFPMMKGIRESLAGRVGLLELYGLSQQEKFAADWKPRAPDFELEPLRERAKSRPFLDISRVFHHIWEGGLPKGVTAEDDLRTEYFNSYIETYLMRDVAEDGNVRDTLRFRRFLSAAAALAGEQLNYARLAEAAEISEPTARQWILLLEGLGVIYLLPPFSNNALKRLVKTPKLYFMDTGLCAFLASWLTPQTLMRAPSAGIITKTTSSSNSSNNTPMERTEQNSAIIVTATGRKSTSSSRKTECCTRWKLRKQASRTGGGSKTLRCWTSPASPAATAESFACARNQPPSTK